jgi:hypothetical protein
MKRSLLIFALSLLMSTSSFAESGHWTLADGDACSIVIIGPAGGSLSGAYRIRNTGKARVALFLNKCTQRRKKAVPPAGSCPADESALKGSVILPVGNTIDLFVNSCLEVDEIGKDAKGQDIGRGSEGTYENLSHVSAP